MDPRLLAAAYDRSAEGYDVRFRALQREKFRAAAPFLRTPRGLCVDAGGGSGLLVEWAREECPPLASAPWLVVDLSLGMLRIARERALAVRGDLARLPLRSADLVCAFTSILSGAAAALRELGSAVAPGGQLAASFLSGEAPPAPLVAQWSGLRLEAGPVAAGQDRLLVLRKDVK